MKRFRLLKQTRQSTEYSCGASCLQAVLSYWGRDLDEEDLRTFKAVAGKYGGSVTQQRIIPVDSLAGLVLGLSETGKRS